MSAVQSTSVSLAQQVRKTVSTSQAQFLAFVKQINLPRTLTQSQVASTSAVKLGTTYHLTVSTTQSQTLSLTTFTFTLALVRWAAALEAFQTSGAYPQAYWALLHAFSLDSAAGPPVNWTGSPGHFSV